MRLGDICHNPRNYRTHPPLQKTALADTIEEIGWAGVPLVYPSQRTGSLTFVDGHLRKELLPDAQVQVAITDLSDEEADNLLVRYDALTGLAVPDPELLQALLADTITTSDAVQQMLDDVLNSLDLPKPDPPDDPGAQLDKAAELQEKWQVKAGDLWEIGTHRLVCGDCTDGEVVGRVMGEKAIEAIITDPPYGIGWDTDYTRFTTECGTKRISHPKVVGDDESFDPRPWLHYPKVVLWGANWYCKHIPLGSWLVWDKRYPGGSAWLSDAELGWMKGKRGVYLYAETVQGAHRGERAMHPTQKPVGLMTWCIEKANIANSILDPFLGSGTVMVSCEGLGKACRGIEIEPRYCSVALQRMQDMGLQPELVSNGW